MPNFVKIRPGEEQFFRADRRTDASKKPTLEILQAKNMKPAVFLTLVQEKNHIYHRANF